MGTVLAVLYITGEKAFSVALCLRPKKDGVTGMGNVAG